MSPEQQVPEALSILVREHREVEQHLDAARQWIPVLQSEGAAAVDSLVSELQSFGHAVRSDLGLHIAHEDRALFIVMGRHIGQQTGPIAVMLMEHRHLERAVDAYERALMQRDAEGLADAAADIVQVLSAHMMKEERVLFPMASRVLSNEEWQEVLDLIQSQG